MALSDLVSLQYFGHLIQASVSKDQHRVVVAALQTFT